MDQIALSKLATLYSNPYLQVQVYSATLPDGTTVAVKEQVHPTFSAANQALSEGLLQTQLSHPYICHCHRIWLENGSAEGVKTVLVMELMQKDLMTAIQERVERGEYWEERVLLWYLQCIASALGYAKSKQVAHRDIKPHNLLLAADQTLKLGDFGSARQFPDLSQSIQGTPLFLSPELRILLLNRLSGIDSSHHCDYYKSDVYSLGLTMLSAAALRKPTDGVENTLKGLGNMPILQEILTGMLKEIPENRPSFEEIEGICAENLSCISASVLLSQASAQYEPVPPSAICCICGASFLLSESPTPFICSQECSAALERSLAQSDGKCQHCRAEIGVKSMPVVLSCGHLFHSVLCFKDYLSSCGLDYLCTICMREISEMEVDMRVYEGYYRELDLTKREICCSVCMKMAQKLSSYGSCCHRYCDGCRSRGIDSLLREKCWLCASGNR